MSSIAVGNKPPTIKPDDLVRTPDGRTAVCFALTPDGARLLRDVFSGDIFKMQRESLYLVRASTPKPWPSRRP